MNGKDKIRKTLIKTGMMDEAAANAAAIWKGYDRATMETGWHLVPFNGTAQYLGRTIAESIEDIERDAEQDESRKEDAARVAARALARQYVARYMEENPQSDPHGHEFEISVDGGRRTYDFKFYQNMGYWEARSV